MFKIGYFEGNEELFDNVRPLWEKTKEYHKDISTYFSSKFEQQNFGARKADLIEKSIQGKIKIIMAKDLDTDIYVGYCVSTIDNKDVGEIDSLFVEPLYRKNGIARSLMEMSLNWMKENNIKTKKLSVAVGNETVFDFYKEFNFYPYQVILEEKEKL